MMNGGSWFTQDGGGVFFRDGHGVVRGRKREGLAFFVSCRNDEDAGWSLRVSVNLRGRCLSCATQSTTVCSSCCPKEKCGNESGLSAQHTRTTSGGLCFSITRRQKQHTTNNTVSRRSTLGAVGALDTTTIQKNVIVNICVMLLVYVLPRRKCYRPCRDEA